MGIMYSLDTLLCCRYALLCKPTSDEWSDKLRESFLRGHQSFLKLLKMMQVGNFNSESVSHLDLKGPWIWKVFDAEYSLPTSITPHSLYSQQAFESYWRKK